MAQQANIKADLTQESQIRAARVPRPFQRFSSNPAEPEPLTLTSRPICGHVQ
jgi:hypothetical protein